MATETPPASPTPSAQPRVEITQEDYDLLQKLKQQNQQPPTESRPDSPKRQKLDDDLQTFVDALAERKIDWMEFDLNSDIACKLMLRLEENFSLCN